VTFLAGRYEEALSWYNQAVSIMKEMYGPNHPEEVSIESNMAWILFKQGK
jgi:hypothetical protein